LIVDTSIWVEFFRGTGSAAHRAIEARIRAGERIVVPDVVLAEILVGTTDEEAAAKLERTLAQFDLEPTLPIEDARAAARIHRSCRRAGETVRSLIDCYVAAVGVRTGLPVMHRDRDFEVLRRHVGVETISLLDDDVRPSE
jgi:predicted nucleic acid-binding protein